ncbi:MAG: hypothetical protein H6747_14290 [Deltaproteobacteria bacterium]|nr:hypothetical protein [Deltaproteobacteria bacterium]
MREDRKRGERWMPRPRRIGLFPAVVALGVGLLAAPATGLAAARPAPATHGLSLELVEIFRGVGQFRYEYGISNALHVGAILGGGSPTRGDFDRFNALDLGVHAALFALGDRSLGLGVMGQLVWRGGWASREDAGDFGLPASNAFSSGLVPEAGLVLRAAASSGLYAEANWTLRYVYSSSTATQGENTATDVESYVETRLGLWAGWMF